MTVRAAHPAQHRLQLAPIALLAQPELAKGGRSIGALLGQCLAQSLCLQQRIQLLNTLGLGFGERLFEMRLDVGNRLAVAAVEEAKQ